MEILAKTEYQDVYRITDGVLLIVNKFLYTQTGAGYYPRILTNRYNSRKYNKDCQDFLKVLTKECKDRDEILPVGTVLYKDCPVNTTNNKEAWDYEIKTTGSMFSGDYAEMIGLLDQIKKIIEEE